MSTGSRLYIWNTKPTLSARQRPSCRVRQLVDGEAVDFDGARGRTIEAAEQIQQRGLARTRGPHQRDEIAARQVQIELLEHRHHFAAALVLLGDAAQTRDDRIRLVCFPLPPCYCIL